MAGALNRMLELLGQDWPTDKVFRPGDSNKANWPTVPEDTSELSDQQASLDKQGGDAASVLNSVGMGGSIRQAKPQRKFTITAGPAAPTPDARPFQSLLDDAGPGVNVNTGPTASPADADPQGPQPRLSPRVRVRPSHVPTLAQTSTPALDKALGSLQDVAQSPRPTMTPGSRPPTTDENEAQNGAPPALMRSLQSVMLTAAPQKGDPLTQPSGQANFDDQLKSAQEQAGRNRRSNALSRSLAHATELITHGAAPMDASRYAQGAADAEKPVQDVMERFKIKNQEDVTRLKAQLDAANISNKTSDALVKQLQEKLNEGKETRQAEGEKKKTDIEQNKLNETIRHNKADEGIKRSKGGEKALAAKDALDESQQHIDNINGIMDQYRSLPGVGPGAGKIDERAFDAIPGNPGNVFGVKKDGTPGNAGDARDLRRELGLLAIGKEASLSRSIFRNPNNMALIRGTYGLLQYGSEDNLRRGMKQITSTVARERAERGMSGPVGGGAAGKKKDPASYADTPD